LKARAAAAAEAALEAQAERDIAAERAKNAREYALDDLG
jgi:hypothetical protein